jgi:hypothetical protein
MTDKPRDVRLVSVSNNGAVAVVCNDNSIWVYQYYSYDSKGPYWKRLIDIPTEIQEDRNDR